MRKGILVGIGLLAVAGIGGFLAYSSYRKAGWLEELAGGFTPLPTPYIAPIPTPTPYVAPSPTPAPYVAPLWTEVEPKEMLQATKQRATEATTYPKRLATKYNVPVKTVTTLIEAIPESKAGPPAEVVAEKILRQEFA